MGGRVVILLRSADHRQVLHCSGAKKAAKRVFFFDFSYKGESRVVERKNVDGS